MQKTVIVCTYIFNRVKYRRRMETEEKAKVVGAVWGDRIYSISCRASCFASVYLEEKDEFNLFFQIDRGKTASEARI